MNRQGAAAFVAGLVFALGLGLAGMTQPNKVLGFLDVAGDWDPRLAFVMMGAIAVHFGFVRLARARSRPVLAPAFVWPTAAGIDAKLVGGAALFGLGWGIAGYCPGPALVASVTAAPATLVFVAAMVAGMAIHGIVTRAGAKAGEGPAPARTPPVEHAP